LTAWEKIVGSRDYYAHGDHNALCDVCGFKFKASELKQRWDGLMCCQQDWEPRHPQDFVRGIAETAVPDFIRPRETILAATCTPATCSAIPGVAGPGCGNGV